MYQTIILRFSRKHQQLLQQLTQFPLAKNDDGPDALEMAVNIAQKPTIVVGGGWIINGQKVQGLYY